MRTFLQWLPEVPKKRLFRVMIALYGAMIGAHAVLMLTSTFLPVDIMDPSIKAGTGHWILYSATAGYGFVVLNAFIVASFLTLFAMAAKTRKPVWLLAIGTYTVAAYYFGAAFVPVYEWAIIALRLGSLAALITGGYLYLREAVPSTAPVDDIPNEQLAQRDRAERLAQDRQSGGTRPQLEVVTDQAVAASG